MLKNSKNNGMEEIGLVTPTPGIVGEHIKLSHMVCLYALLLRLYPQFIVDTRFYYSMLPHYLWEKCLCLSEVTLTRIGSSDKQQITSIKATKCETRVNIPYGAVLALSIFLKILKQRHSIARPLGRGMIQIQKH